jgi:hypothetical protein
MELFLRRQAATARAVVQNPPGAALSATGLEQRKEQT